MLESARKEFLNVIVMNPAVFIISRLSVILSTILLTKFIVFSNLQIPKKTFDFVVVGSISYNYALSIIMPLGRSLMNEKRFKTLSNLILGNISLTQYFMGVFIANLPFVFFETSIAILFSMAVGFRLYIGSNILLFFAVVLLSIAGYSIGAFMSYCMVMTEYNFTIQNVIIAVLFFFCGITFPVQRLPLIGRSLAGFIPLTKAIGLVRNVLISGKTIEFSFVLQLIIFSVLLYVFSIFMIKKHIEQVL